MQQWTGINFIFYFGTVFFTSLGTISNPFLISLITTLVNVCSTPLSFWTVERFGRRAILFWGAIGMVVCEYICAIAGTASQSPSVVKAQISFICIYIFFFAVSHQNLIALISSLPGDLLLGSLSVKSSPSPSVLVVSPSRPPPTGSGTVSSQSSPPTWSTPTRPTSSPRCSLSGARLVSSVSFTPTCWYGRPRV